MPRLRKRAASDIQRHSLRLFILKPSDRFRFTWLRADHVFSQTRGCSFSQRRDKEGSCLPGWKMKGWSRRESPGHQSALRLTWEKLTRIIDRTPWKKHNFLSLSQTLQTIGDLKSVFEPFLRLLAQMYRSLSEKEEEITCLWCQNGRREVRL